MKNIRYKKINYCKSKVYKYILKIKTCYKKNL